MSIRRFARTRAPRLTPLASCLALALVVAGASGQAAQIRPRPDRTDRVLPTTARLDRAQIDAWLAEPFDRKTIEDHWRAVLQRPIPAVPANSIAVTNCNDSGAGSLRDAVNSANSGDTIDLTNTGCSTITLTTGAIAVTQATLTLQGPGSIGLAIDANNQTLALQHTGTGTLYVNDLTVKNGYKYFTDAQVDAARGGCIFSGGYVFLSNSEVKYCKAGSSNTHYGVYGGAIYAASGVTLESSTVFSNTAYSSGFQAEGGGIMSPGTVTIRDSVVEDNKSYSVTTWSLGGGAYATMGLSVKYSTIADNVAYNGPTGLSRGGGLYSDGNLSVENSTLRGNMSRSGGAIFALGNYATTDFTVLSSTISGNHAVVAGGIDFEDTDAQIANSTIAFNEESFSTSYGAGLFVFNNDVDLESTLISNNYSISTGTPVEDDVGTTGNASYAGTLSGSNNLITLASMTVPSGTITAKYGRLEPLAYNGGTTATHRLMSPSPAIDAGNDAANVNYDQRGAPYLRVIGSSADIGAFELDTADAIFADGFNH